MAAASSSTSLFKIRDEDHHQQSSSTPHTSTAAPQSTAPQKKKRNLPGNPNPDSEVIALSPKTLMATNRFICEVCNKGFQREQNLQLHRRGHNLPWKLRQKSSKEVQRRKVYLCPEPTCVHHDPSRALGDLTGIKKHFCRKHGEKKWKCDKCSKRYAVQSDWKAHSKTCGTREYRCDCGTLFSRRDSFITHRAFCDALAQESARFPTGLNTTGSHLYGNNNMGLVLPQVNSQLSNSQEQAHPSTDLLCLGGGSGGGSQFEHLMSQSNNHSSFRHSQAPSSSAFFHGGGPNPDFNEEPQSHDSMLQNKPFHGLMQLPDLQGSASATASAAAANLFNLSFFSNSSNASSINNRNEASNKPSHLLIPEQFNSGNGTGDAANLFSGNLMSDHMRTGVPSLYNTLMPSETVFPQMSATALLQKAAQMGATASCGGSLFRGFGNSSADVKPTNFQTGYSGGGGSAGGEGLRSQSETENHLNDLMNSLANGSSNIFGGSGAVAPFVGSCTTGGRQQGTGLAGFNASLSNMDEAKYQHNRSASSLGGSDGLTRDFLGVGSMVRNIGGALSQRDQHHGIDMGSFDPEMKSASSSRSFPGGNLQ